MCSHANDDTAILGFHNGGFGTVLKSKYYWEGDMVYDIVERKDTSKS